MTPIQACLQILESSIDRFNELECDVQLIIFQMDMLITLAMRLYKAFDKKYQSNKFIKNRGFAIICTFSFLMHF